MNEIAPHLNPLTDGVWSAEGAEFRRAAVLDIAALQLGVTDPKQYWLEAFGQLPQTDYQKLAWCGVFALWCLRTAGLTDWHWVSGVGFLLNHGADGLNHITLPEPGDVAYFDKPYAHHALVQECDGTTVKLIQGNYGLPGRVAESEVNLRTKKPIFFSIARWL
jgi:hypothetical protein